MAKKIVAVTNIIHNGEFIKFDDVVDPSKFTKEQLTRFYERGVIKIVDEAELAPAPTLDDVEANKTPAIGSSSTPTE